MSGTVAIFDTSLLCCWLKVPGKETAGSGSNTWTAQRVDHRLQEVIKRGATVILPLATVIETGNHIAQASSHRFERATTLCSHLKDAISSRAPWATFTEQASFWNDERILSLAEEWPKLASSKLSFGDITIKDVANYYATAGFEVVLLTADEQLRAYEPAKPTKVPRRRLQT